MFLCDVRSARVATKVGEGTIAADSAGELVGADANRAVFRERAARDRNAHKGPEQNTEPPSGHHDTHCSASSTTTPSPA